MVSKTFKNIIKPLETATLNSKFKSEPLNTNEENIYHNVNMTGSTDMGDLSEKMPVIQPTMGGFSGALHSKEFEIADKETVYISAAKILACTAHDLLKDNARKALEIKNNFKSQDGEII